MTKFWKVVSFSFHAKSCRKKQFQQNICEMVAQAAILYPDQVVLDVFLGGFIEVDQNSCLDPFQP